MSAYIHIHETRAVKPVLNVHRISKAGEALETPLVLETLRERSEKLRHLPKTPRLAVILELERSSPHSH